MSESDEQKSVIKRARLSRETRSIFSIPNGAHLKGNLKQRAIQMNILKAEGFMPGASDLVLPEPIMFRPLLPGECHGLYLEMKRTGDSRTSNQQLAFGEMVTERGYEFAVAHGLDEALYILEQYVKRLREAKKIVSQIKI